jgi:hypothetical protein
MPKGQKKVGDLENIPSTPESNPDHFQDEQPSFIVTLKVTDEILVANPALAGFNVSVGDKITLVVSKVQIFKTPKSDFEVLNSSGGVVRTYTKSEHFEDAEVLAKQYAAKINGSVR